MDSEELVAYGGWFDHYRHLLGRRFTTFKIALSWLHQAGGSVLVETGTMRSPDNWSGDGCSTYLFAEFAARYQTRLWSCDIDPAAMKAAAVATCDFNSSVTFVCADSVEFLDRFDRGIDLLYLDSLDCMRGRARESQEHALAELSAAYSKLTDNAVVLLDDHRHPEGGKTVLTHQYLRDEGWMCLFESRQAVWVRPTAQLRLRG